MPKVSIDVFHLGLVPYAQALRLQLQLHAEVRDGIRAGAILVLQHEPVITLGKNANVEFILSPAALGVDSKIEVLRTDRGGEVTAHEPGQLVVYPILPLQVLRLPPKLYVSRLLQAVILTLDDFGIAAKTDADYPGVWVQQQKICAVGIRVKERVSLHGIALNVCNPLDLFRMIVPCGIAGRGVCSMQCLLRSPLSLSDVALNLIDRLTASLKLPYAWQLAEALLDGKGDDGQNLNKSVRSWTQV